MSNNTTSESIVTSLHWSKMLKAAGWPQDACCHIWAKINGHRIIVPHALMGAVPEYNWARVEEFHAAPTAEEILRRLPDTSSNHSVLIVQHFLEKWHVQYLDGNNVVFHYSDPSLANAAAAMYCYLAENGLLPKA